MATKVESALRNFRERIAMWIPEYNDANVDAELEKTIKQYGDPTHTIFKLGGKPASDYSEDQPNAGG